MPPSAAPAFADQHISRRQLMGWGIGGAALTALPSSLAAFTQTDRFPATRAFVTDYVTSHRLPGALAVVGEGDRPLVSIAAGTVANDSRVPVDINTLWRIYSMTKPITGIAVMMLIDQRRLTLDTPLSEVLPRFADMRVLARPDAPLDETVALARPITIRHILTHTAGLGYGLARTTPLDRAWSERHLTPGQVTRLQLPGFPTGATMGPLDRWADAVSELPLLAQPGTRWSYSAGLDLAGRVIEVVSGQPFDRFLADQMFGPLGMTSTSFRVAPANVARLATNYAPVGGALFPIDPAATSVYLDAPSFAFGGAGLVTSARDYDRFLMMMMHYGQLGRARILSRATAQLAMSNLLPAGTDTANTFVTGQGFGAGGRVSLPGSAEGPGVYGWGGAAGTVAYVDPLRRRRFGGYANYMPSEAYDFQRRLPAVMLGDFGISVPSAS